MKMTLILISTFFFTNAFADWTPRERAYFRMHQLKFEDPYVATLSGICQLLVRYSRRQNFKSDTKKVTFRGKKVRIRQAIKKDPKRPLLIYIPGIFSDIKSTQAKRVTVEAFRNGFNVLSFSNPWSTDYLSRIKGQEIGNFEQAANNLYELMVQVINNLKAKGKISTHSVTIMGVSYGALLSAVIKKIDQDNHQIINHAPMLVSPPENIQVTFNILDEKIKWVNEQFNAIGKKNYSPLKAFKYCFLNEDSHLSDIKKKQAKMIIIAHGFRDNLMETMKFAGISTRPNEDVSFIKFIKENSPKAYQLITSEKGSLKYWLKQIKDYNLYSTKDDFVNPPGAFSDMLIDKTIINDRGGHFGLRGTKAFTELMKVLAWRYQK